MKNIELKCLGCKFSIIIGYSSMDLPISVCKWHENEDIKNIIDSEKCNFTPKNGESYD